MMLQALKRRFSDGRFAQVRLVRMSDGHLALVRELGLVKGGRGLRLHEKLISFSARAAATLALGLISKHRQTMTNTAANPAADTSV